MNTQRLTLDLDKSSVPRGRVTIAQCDHDGTTVEAEIYDNGIALSTSGLSAYLVMRLPDGRHYYRVSATLDGHVATALVDEAYAATATGTTEIAYFELVGSGGVVYSTSRFGVRVLPSATADATVPETWDGEVERLIQQLDEMAEDSREIIDDLTTLEETVGAAEQGRVAAEQGRVSAETARANAETARANAESGRVSAEQGRVVAEQGRVTAESGRVTEFATLKSESQAATSAATTAAGNADAAATRANTAAQNANAAAANADATADGVESRVQEMAQDAAETATADAEQRIQDAIDAMGDISELAVPLMSADVRGGARLEEHGGLVLRDEMLGIGSLVQESDGYARGGLADVTAKGHAEQLQTTGKNLAMPYVVNDSVNDEVKFYYLGKGIWLANGTRTASNSQLNSFFSYSMGVLDAGSYVLTVRLVSGSCSRYGARLGAGSSSSYVSSTNSTVDNQASIAHTFTADGNSAYWASIAIVGGATATNAVFSVQCEAGSTATSYEPYTGAAPSPSPEFSQTIEVVRGRNLLNYDEWKSTSVLHGTGIWENNGVTLTATVDDCYTAWQIDGTSPITTRVSVSEGDVITLSWEADSDANGQCYIFGNGDASLMVKVNNASAKSVSYTVPSGVTFVTFRLGVASAGTTIRYSNVQISIGSTPQPYVPYGHVGMEARDPDTDELISCTPIPLPSRGWVGSLPDGTADVLMLDGAGKVEWTLPTSEVVLDGSETVTAENGNRRVRVRPSPSLSAKTIDPNTLTPSLCTHFIGCTPGQTYWASARAKAHAVLGADVYFTDLTNAMNASDFKSWLQSNPVTVLYQLAAPVIEELGYIDPPEIPSEAIVSIPELDALGVKYFVDDSAGTLARQWYERAKSEYESRLSTLESIVAGLV